MQKSLFVISDLHLGGAAGFQLCSTAGRARLARFIDWVSDQKRADAEVHLVLNGDIVDFLAEMDEAGGYSAFVVDENRARRKLTRIADGCDPVFAALRHFTARSNRLTLLIGNHDVELCLPAVRGYFLGLLGEGRIEYLYDNEAYTVGPVLIEHGNRYDGWNMVNHGELRQIRSRLSRREAVREFSAQPGSELVARVMNPIKERFAFVDLLKPETGGVLPILAVLNPGLWQEAGTALRERAAAWYRGQFSSEGTPVRSDYVGAYAASQATAPRTDVLPEDLRNWFDAADTAAESALPSGGEVRGVRSIAVAVLLKAIRAWRGRADQTFSIEHEDDEYLIPARTLAMRFPVVIFGHTHLAKRIDLGNGALYLNAGTWADIMRMPSAVYDGDEAAGTEALKRFLDDVESNNIAGFRRQIATFARIELDANENIESADVYFFDDDARAVPISNAGMSERMA